jgi:ribokinase
MRRVIVVGSVNADLTVKTERLPRMGETVSGEAPMVSCGGKGANQAVAALKAGASVTLIAKIGSDDYGNLLYTRLRRAGLGPEGLLRDPREPAGLALILVDNVGNNQIIVIPGSNGNLTVDDFRSVESLMERGSIFLTQLEIPLSTVEYALRLAKDRGMTTILDPAPVSPLPSRVYPVVDILTPNETEAERLTGRAIKCPAEAEKAASTLLSRGCGKVIITLGAQGALLSYPGGTECFPAPPTLSIDAVAAGDAFNGALAAALAAGESLSHAIRFANAAGALSTTKRGAQESLPAKNQIEAFLRSRFSVELH